ncbi:MAG: hypothetical protein PWP34_302 [Desulfuromonadales bacterium]|jgi:hypothetical protein|nr:hypothetical protein [Desulfuromonadales bacterium]
MKVQQISIFIENIPGRLAEATKVLGDAGVNIRALSLADTSDFGVLRLIVDKNDLAKQVLAEHDFTVSKTDVVAVEVPDRPAGLADILQELDAAGITVEYLYAFVERLGDNAVIIFRFDNVDGAVKTLRDKGIKILPGESVYNL